MNIQHNISLKPFNTFGINAIAQQFVEINSISELEEVIKKKPSFFILGGGSNILFTQEIIPFVIKLNLKGIDILNYSNDDVFIKVHAGEDWHSFVLWCINNNFGGLENLSLIPGNAGAAPIQNIGAYGVEVKDVIEEVETLEINTLHQHLFKNSDCQFAYRNSIFKKELKGKHIITSVMFKLSNKNHTLNFEYGAISEELSSKGITNPTIKDISEAVISIRESKLPNPKVIGNGGSFFKNPVTSISHFKELQIKYPSIPHYPISENEVKIPAGWLIEQAGFKGIKKGNTGVHSKQALVLVNYGNAKGIEILELAAEIQDSILKIFNISLEIEVNIY
ncbi:MAG: UDP-N-acetylmuramate dehydrogenase [Flavobacteriaceae bacterium]|nr:UDP-N-acetylmuramate dehydrogenase [Flavobacteriaceae bacterium]